ncbi:TPA: HNH endonuclease [Escherichia coli]
MSERKITVHRQVLDAIGVRPGSPHSVAVRRVISTHEKLGKSAEEISAIMLTSPELRRWQVLNEKRQGTLPPAPTTEQERIQLNAQICAALKLHKGSPRYRPLRALVKTMLLAGLCREEIIADVQKSDDWAKRVKYYEQQAIAQERREAQRKVARIAKAHRIANLPRDQRLGAWGMFRPKIINPVVDTPLHKHLTAQKAWFDEMTVFARRAQAQWQENQNRMEAARIFEQTRERHRQEEQARRDKQREARLESLEKEISLEESQKYVRDNVPDYRLEEFRRWFRREYEGDTSCLIAGVDEFLALTGQTSAPAPAAPVPVSAPVVQLPDAKPVVLTVNVPKKREGNLTIVRSRPDQAAFAQAVKDNCYAQCVITGTRLMARCEAAHLVEHKQGGADHYTNGLLLRADIHALFDASLCAIDPANLTVHFTPDALFLDPDLQAFEGKKLSAVRKPINPEFLRARWETFQKECSAV